MSNGHNAELLQAQVALEGESGVHPSSAVDEGRKLLHHFRRDRRASSVDRGHASRGRGGQRRPRLFSGPSLSSDAWSLDDAGGRETDGPESSPYDASSLSNKLGNALSTLATRDSASEKCEGVDAASFGTSLRSGDQLPARPMAGARRGQSMSADLGLVGRDSAYEVQLAEVLERWNAERATMADLQGRAAAAANLHGKVRSPTEALTRTQAELEATRRELDSARRGKEAAEREMAAWQAQAKEEKHAAEVCATEKDSLLAKVEHLESLAARSDELSAEIATLRKNARDIGVRLQQSEERLKHSEELRSSEAEKWREALEAMRTTLSEEESEAKERLQERSARAAGLQALLQEQSALLAEREEKLAEERSGRAAERMELRNLRSREAGYVRELNERAQEIEELNQVLAQLQEGDNQVAEATAATQALQSENAKLQDLVTQAREDASVAERRAREAEERADRTKAEEKEELLATQERLRDVETERSQLEQRLGAVEARVSEAARSRADLSRRLAETVIEAEAAGVEKERLERRVRSLSEPRRGEDGETSSSSEDGTRLPRKSPEGLVRGGGVSTKALRAALGSDSNKREKADDTPATMPPSVSRATAAEPPSPDRMACDGLTILDEERVLRQAASSVLISDLRCQLKAVETLLSTSTQTEAGVSSDLAEARSHSVPGGTPPNDKTIDERAMIEALYAVRRDLNAALLAVYHDDVQWSYTQAVAKNDLVAEADRNVTLEQERATERSCLQQQDAHGATMPPARVELTIDAEMAAARTIVSVASQSVRRPLSGKKGLHVEERSLDELRLLCRELEEEVVTAREKVATSNENRDSAQVEAATLAASNRELKRALSVAEGKSRESEAEISALHARVETIKTETSAEASRVRGDLKSRICEAEARASALAHELDLALKAKAANSPGADEAVLVDEDVERAADRRQRQLEQRLDLVYDEVAAANAKATRASERSAMSAAEAAKSSMEAGEWRHRVLTAEKELRIAREEVEALRATKTALESRLQQALQAAEAAEIKLQGTGAEADQLRRRASGLEDKLATVEAARTSMIEKEAEATAELRKAIAREADLHAALEKATVGLNDARTQGAEEVAAWRDCAGEASRRAEKAEEQAKAARAEAGDAAAKVSAARVKGEAMEADLAAVRAWAEAGSQRAGATLADMQRRVKEMESSITAQKQRAERAEMERCTILEDHQALEADLRKRLDETQIKLETMARSTATERAQMEASFLEETARLQKLMDTAQSTAGSLQCDLAHMTEELREAQEAQCVAAAAAASSTATLRTQLAKASAELERTKATLSEQMSAQAAAVQRAEQAEVEARAELGRAKETLSRSAASLAQESQSNHEREESMRADFEAVKREQEVARKQASSLAAQIQLRCDAAEGRAAAAELEISKAQELARSAKHREQMRIEEVTKARNDLLTAVEAEREARASSAAEKKGLELQLDEIRDELAHAKATLLAQRSHATAQATTHVQAFERLEIAARSAEADARAAAAGEVNRLRLALETANAEVEDAEATARVSEERLRESVEQIEAFDKRTKARKAENARTAADLVEARNALASVKANEQAVSEKLEVSRSAEESAVEQVRRFKAELLDVRRAVDEKQQEDEASRHTLQSQMSAAQEALRLSRNRADSLAEELTASQLDCSRLSTALETVERTVVGLRERLHQAEEDVRNHTARLEAQDLDNSRAVEELEKKVLIANEQKEEAQRDLTDVKRLADTLTLDLELVRRTVSQRDAALDRLKDDVVASSSQLDVLKAELRNRESGIPARDGLVEADDDSQESRWSSDFTHRSETSPEGATTTLRSRLQELEAKLEEELKRAERLEAANTNLERIARERELGLAELRREKTALLAAIEIRGNSAKSTGANPRRTHACALSDTSGDPEVLGDIETKAGQLARVEGTFKPASPARAADERQSGEAQDGRESRDSLSVTANSVHPVDELRVSAHSSVELIDEEHEAAKAEGAGVARADLGDAAKADNGREQELTRRLSETLAALEDAEARLTDAKLWDEAQKRWARDMEETRRREKGTSAARIAAEAARAEAESKLDGVVAQLGRRTKEREIIDARLREVGKELAAARRSLREAGAERELLGRRLEEARHETEELLRFQAKDEHGVPLRHDQDRLQEQSFLPTAATIDGSRGHDREAFLCERALREEAEMRYVQVRAAMDEQLELDTGTLERMDELARQARVEQEETVAEKDRLQACVHELERGKDVAEGALAATQDELEDACRDLEEATNKLACSRRDHAATEEHLMHARTKLAEAELQLAEVRNALSDAQLDLAETKRALAAARTALSESASELQSTKEAYAASLKELSAVGEELEEVRLNLASAKQDVQHSPSSVRQCGEGSLELESDGALVVVGRRLSTVEGELAAVRTELSNAKEQLRTALAEARTTRGDLAADSKAEQEDASRNAIDDVEVPPQPLASTTVLEEGCLLHSEEVAMFGQEISIVRRNESRSGACASGATSPGTRASMEMAELLRATQRKLALADERVACHERERADMERNIADLRAQASDHALLQLSKETDSEKLQLALEDAARAQDSLKKMEQTLAAAEKEKELIVVAGRHHEKLLASTAETSRALQAQLDRAHELRAASEEKAVSLAQKLAQAQADAHVVALEAERAEDRAEIQQTLEEETWKELKREKEALEERVVSLDEALRAAESLAREREEGMSALEAKNRTLAHEAGVGEVAIAAARAEAERFEAEVTEAETRVESAECRTIDALRRAETAAAETESSKLLLDEAEAALAGLKDKLTASESQCSASARDNEHLTKLLTDLRERTEEVSTRELQEEAKRRRLETLLQETRAELENSDAATDAAAIAEREAFARAQDECHLRETAERTLVDIEKELKDAREERARFQEEAARLEAEVQAVCEREAAAADLLAQAEAGRAAASREADEAGKQLSALRAELTDARRRRDEEIAEGRALRDQVAYLRQDVASAREKESRAQDELSESRAKTAAAESKAASSSRDAEKQLTCLRSEAQAKEARVAELEAQVEALRGAHERLARSRDALVDEVSHAQDLLGAAAERMRRSRSVGRVERSRHPFSPAGNASVDISVYAGAHDVKLRKSDLGSEARPDSFGQEDLARAEESLPPRHYILDSQLDLAVREGGSFAGRRRRSRRSSRLNSSAPMWAVDRDADSAEVSRLVGRNVIDDGVGAEEEHGAASAAMEVLKEVEYMHASLWKMRQHERTLEARVGDAEEALLVSQEREKAAEGRMQKILAENEHLIAQSTRLEEESLAKAKELEERREAADGMRKRVQQLEPDLEDVKAKLRAAQDQTRRLRGQLEATGLSDTAMMSLLRGKDAALAAAAARTTALEEAKREADECAQEAGQEKQVAESLAESLKGQLEGLGTFDRRTRSMLERAEEEIRHLREQGTEGDEANKALQERVTTLTREAEELAAELHECEAAVAMRDELLAKAEESGTAWKERLATVQEELEQEAGKAASAEVLASSERESALRLREELDMKKITICDLREDLGKAQATVRDRSRVEASQAEEIKALLIRVQLLEDNIEEKSARETVLREAAETRDHELRDEQEALRTAEGEAEALREKVSATSKRLAEVEEALTREEADGATRLQDASSEIAALKEHMERERAASRTAREQGNKLSEQVAVLEADVEDRCRRLEEMERTTKAIVEERDSLKREHDVLRETANRLERSTAGQLDQILTLEVRVEESRARTDDLQAELRTTKEEAGLARESLAEAKAGLSMAREALSQAQASLDVERAGVAAAREDLATTRERLRRSQDEDLANALRRLEQTGTELANARSEISALTEARNALDLRASQEAADAAAAQEAVFEKVAAVEAACEERIKALETRSAQTLQETLSLAETSKADASQARAKAGRLAEELAVTKERWEKAEAEHAAAIESAKVVGEEREHLKRRCRAADEQVQAQRSRIENLSEEAEALKHRTDGVEQALAETREELLQHEAKIETSEDALAGTRAALAEARRDAETNATRAALVDEEKAEAARNVDSLKERIAEAEAVLQAMHETQENLESRLRTAEEERKTQQDSLVCARGEADALRRQLSEALAAASRQAGEIDVISEARALALEDVQASLVSAREEAEKTQAVSEERDRALNELQTAKEKLTSAEEARDAAEVLAKKKTQQIEDLETASEAQKEQARREREEIASIVERALRQDLADVEQDLATARLELAEHKSTMQAEADARAAAESALQEVREECRMAVEAAEAREQAIDAEARDLRGLKVITKELREQLAAISAQLVEAGRSAAEMKSKRTAAIAAAEAANNLQKSTADEAAQAAEAASEQSANDRETIRALEKALKEAEACAAADKTASEAPYSEAQEARISAERAERDIAEDQDRLRLLSQKLDDILQCVRDTVAISSRSHGLTASQHIPELPLVGEEKDDGTKGSEEGSGAPSRMLDVAAQAAAYALAVRAAIEAENDEVVAVQQELRAKLEEVDRLRSQNVLLEESLAEVSGLVSTRTSAGATNGDLSVGGYEPPVIAAAVLPAAPTTPAAAAADGGASQQVAGAEPPAASAASMIAGRGVTSTLSINLDAARVAALERTNSQLRSLVETLLEKAAADPRRHIGQADSVRTSGGLLSIASGSENAASGGYKHDARSVDGDIEGGGSPGSAVEGFAKDTRDSPSAIPRAMRSLVDALQERDARIEMLECRARRAHEKSRTFEEERQGEAAMVANMRAELASLRIFSGSESERARLEAQLETVSRDAKSAARGAEAREASLRAALEASKRETEDALEERRGNMATTEEALEVGRERVLALQDALERAVDVAKLILMRAEVATAQAEDGKVEALEIGLSLPERSGNQISRVRGNDSRRQSPRDQSTSISGATVDQQISRPRTSSQSPVNGTCAESGGSRFQRRRAEDRLRSGGPAFDTDFPGSAGRGMTAEAAGHAAALEMESVLLEIEAIILAQAMARARDVSGRSRGTMYSSQDTEDARAAAVKAEDEERRALTDRVRNLEEEVSRSRRETEEKAAAVEAMRSQREGLVRRVAAAEAEAALSRAIERSTGPYALADPSVETQIVSHVEEQAATVAAAQSALATTRSELSSARNELDHARGDLQALRTRLAEEDTKRMELVNQARLTEARRESDAVIQARTAAAEKAAMKAQTDANTAKDELGDEKRAAAAARRKAERLEEQLKGLEEELDAAARRWKTREEHVKDLDTRLQAETRQKLALEHELRTVEASRREGTSHGRVANDPVPPQSLAAEATTTLVSELRGQVFRARERAELLEERLDETTRNNRRLEKEVADAVELGARAEAELGAALAGERLRRDGELTEIKSVVDEMMVLDASATGGGVAGMQDASLSFPRKAAGRDYKDRSTTMIEPAGGVVYGVSCPVSRLNEAWSLLEASEAARRRLQEEAKGWAERAARLEEALAAAEVVAEERAREARLLAASLQDAREGLASEEAARREAEGRAEALRNMLTSRGTASGGGVSPGAHSGGGDVASNLAGQVKALRSRVEELLERARDAEVREVIEKRGRKAAQRALSELTSNRGDRKGGGRGSGDSGAKRRATRSPSESSSFTPARSTSSGGVATRATFASFPKQYQAVDARHRDADRPGFDIGDDGRGGGMENDTGWLREAEALLSRSSQDLRY